jgi:hypothetical protein
MYKFKEVGAKCKADELIQHANYQNKLPVDFNSIQLEKRSKERFDKSNQSVS